MKPNLIDTNAVSNAYKNILKIRKREFKTLSFNINIFFICIIFIFLFMMYKRFYEKIERNKLIVISKRIINQKKNKEKQITQNTIKPNLFFNEYRLNI
jgi:hypothetical protein